MAAAVDESPGPDQAMLAAAAPMDGPDDTPSTVIGILDPAPPAAPMGTMQIAHGASAFGAALRTPHYGPPPSLKTICGHIVGVVTLISLPIAGIAAQVSEAVQWGGAGESDTKAALRLTTAIGAAVLVGVCGLQVIGSNSYRTYLFYRFWSRGVVVNFQRRSAWACIPPYLVVLLGLFAFGVCCAYTRFDSAFVVVILFVCEAALYVNLVHWFDDPLLVAVLKSGGSLSTCHVVTEHQVQQYWEQIRVRTRPFTSLYWYHLIDLNGMADELAQGALKSTAPRPRCLTTMFWARALLQGSALRQDRRAAIIMAITGSVWLGIMVNLWFRGYWGG